MSKSKSWVWQYAKRVGDKGYCNMCDEDNLNEFACAGGSTGSLGRHLKFIHNIWPTNSQSTESTRFYNFLLYDRAHHSTGSISAHQLFLFFSMFCSSILFLRIY